ncbi:l-ascorbate oxidase-like protein [Hordeum vulgare]|nr:l-ascorbate oxidase-like protein [Hordeum vulgare]
MLVPSPMEAHVEGTTLEFVVMLCGPIRGHLHLPYPFARVMEVDKLPVLWLRAHGYCNGATRADVEYLGCHAMLLGHGWKSFARAHILLDGHVLHFKMVEADMLSVRIYGCLGARLSCCEKSSSGAKCPSSSDSDEVDSDSDRSGEGSKLQAVRSEYGELGSD